VSIQAILFDLDGVLIDAAEWHYRAFHRAIRLFGYDLARGEHERDYNGLPTSVKLELLSQRRGFPRGLHSVAHRMKQIYTRDFLSASCVPDPSLAATLHELAGAGYRLAVASNSIRETLDTVLGRLGIAGFFELTLSNEDVRRPKPDPEIYLRCLERMGLSGEQCLVVEDSPPGIQAARGATPYVMVVKSPRELTARAIRAQIAAQGAPPLEIVVPMAGLGTRFRDRGFPDPKPLIDVRGKPMVQWVIENVRPRRPHRFTFLCNEAHAADYGLEARLSELVPGCSVVRVPGATEGAACTALLAKDCVPSARPLLIANSDQWVDAGIDEFLAMADDTHSDGLIMTFPATDSKWSYARLGPDGTVAEVAEKRAISAHATVGIYYFRRAGDFFEGAEDMIARGLRTNGEYYVCPVYNELIARGRRVRIHPIPAGAMRGLGTPEDLAAFLAAGGAA